MSKLTSYSKSYILSIVITTLITFQPTLARTIRERQPTLDDTQAIDLELWRGPYSQNNDYLLPVKNTRQRSLLNTLYRIGITQFINRDSWPAVSDNRPSLNHNIRPLDLFRDADFQTATRLMYDDADKIIPALEFQNENVAVMKNTVEDTENEFEASENVSQVTLNDNMNESDQATMDSSKSVDKRTSINKRRKPVYCDLSRMTLNMLIEYISTGRVCGSRATPVRFGLGK